jgi:hypothetical protein
LGFVRGGTEASRVDAATGRGATAVPIEAATPGMRRRHVDVANLAREDKLEAREERRIRRGRGSRLTSARARERPRGADRGRLRAGGDVPRDQFGGEFKP